MKKAIELIMSLMQFIKLSLAWLKLSLDAAGGNQDG
jgi:hypothetical protein